MDQDQDMSEYTNDEQYYEDYEDYGDSQDEYYEDSYDETEEHYDGSEESYDESEGDYYDYDYEEETENAVGADHEGEYEYYREDSEGVLKIDEVSEDDIYDYYEESKDEEDQIKNRDDSDVVDDYYEDGYGDYQEYESEPENIENIPHQEDLRLSTTSPTEESHHHLDLDLDEVSDDEDLTEGSSQGKILSIISISTEIILISSEKYVRLDINLILEIFQNLQRVRFVLSRSRGLLNSDSIS